MQIFSLILLGMFCVVEDGPGPMPETARLVVDDITNNFAPDGHRLP